MGVDIEGVEEEEVGLDVEEKEVGVDVDEFSITKTSHV